MKSTALAILGDTAEAHHARLLRAAGDHAVFETVPPTVSGKPATAFHVRIDAIGDDIVKAREDQPILLPSSCPERHINIDGSFCLYWAEAEANAIVDASSAGIWWGKLLVFLKRQQSAAVLRQWPGRSEARAHGPEAARAQLVAERAASELGPGFRRLLDDSRLISVRKKVGGDPRLRLMLDGARLISVRERGQRVMTKRARCKCDDAKRLRLPISGCGSHEIALRDLTMALNRWKIEEDRFFREYVAAGAKCCGTMDYCPPAA
jgi:hypothetical protein